MECKCVENLDQTKKDFYLKRAIAEVQYLKGHTSIIIIFSKLKKETNIFLNGTPFKIAYGYNKICICKIANNFGGCLKIGANYLCKLEKIDKGQIGVEIFTLKTYNHSPNCENNIVPSLLELSYFELFQQGICGEKLKQLYKTRHIPKELYIDRPKARSHLGLFESKNWLSFCWPRGTIITSCKKPMKHLSINVFDHL